MDDPEKTAEQSSGDETTTQDTPTGENQTTENVETQEQTETADPGEGTQETTTEQGHKPTRAEKRLHRLLERYGDGDEDGERNSSQDTASSQDNLPTPPWYQPKVEPGQEVTPDQYKADVARTAQEIAGLEIKRFQQEQARVKEQEKRVTTFNSTVTQIEKQYPVLNPEAKEFNEALSGKVAKLYQKAAGKEPNAELLREIVGTVMEASEHARTEGQSSVTSTLIEQANQTAIAPNGGSERSDLSKAEMDRMKRENPGKLAEVLGKKLSWVE